MYSSLKITHHPFNFQVSALNPHRWSLDGVSVRLAPGLLWDRTLGEWWSLQARLSPLLFLNSHSNRADGTSLPTLGLAESLALELPLFPFLLNLLFVFEQSYQTIWKNRFGYAITFETAANPFFSFGIGIENEFFLVNESTGLNRENGFLDLTQLSWLTFFKLNI